MFRIGDFSRFSRVSVKMLRHYDEIGLLRPASVDPLTGYRYYTADQLPRLNRIIALKDLGFTLEQVARLLDEGLPDSEIRGMLKLRRGEIEQRLEEEMNRLAQIEARLRQHEQTDSPPAHDIVLRQVAPLLIASIREVIPPDGDRVSFLFETLETYVGQHRARAASPPLMLYHDRAFHEDAQDVEVAVPLIASVPENTSVHVRTLPSVTVASLVYTGSYAAMASASHTLLGWVDAHGLRVSGPCREVYLRFGASNEPYTLPDAYLAEQPAEFVTELQAPVEKPASGDRGRVIIT